MSEYQQIPSWYLTQWKQSLLAYWGFMFYITCLISLKEDCWQYMPTDALGKMPMGSSGFRAGPGAQRQLQQMSLGSHYTTRRLPQQTGQLQEFVSSETFIRLIRHK